MNVLKITSGTMKLHDPGAFIDGKADVTVSVPNGDYIVNPTYINIESFGKDSKSRKDVIICAKPNLGKLKTAKWEEVGYISVDSGLTAAFDGSVKMDERTMGYWYHREVASEMDSSDETTLNGKCVVSSTEFGDGTYSVYTATERGKVFAVKVEYISDEDVKYYNTPTLAVDGEILVFHSSETMYPLARIKPSSYNSFVRLPESDSDIIGGIVRYAEYNKRPPVGTVVTDQVKLSTNDFAKLFDLMSISFLGGSSVKLKTDGEFIFTSSKHLARSGNLANAKKRDTKYDFNTAAFKASKGTYAIVAEKVKGEIVGVSIRKIK